MVKVIALNKKEATKLFKSFNARDGGTKTKVSLASIKVVRSDMPASGQKMFNATLVKKK